MLIYILMETCVNAIFCLVNGQQKEETMSFLCHIYQSYKLDDFSKKIAIGTCPSPHWRRVSSKSQENLANWVFATKYCVVASRTLGGLHVPFSPRASEASAARQAKPCRVVAALVVVVLQVSCQTPVSNYTDETSVKRQSGNSRGRGNHNLSNKPFSLEL